MKAVNRLAPLLAVLAMLGPFSVDTFFPAFRVMEAQFGVTATSMQQTLSLYLGSYAVMSLLHGPLSDAYGRRPVILVSTALFALATLGCALAPNFTTLLAFRIAQGVAAGAGLIVGRAIIRDRFAGPDAQRLMSQVSMIFSAAPALAPVVGGLLVGLGGWRSIFGVLAVFTVLTVLWCWRALPETLPLAQRRPISPRSLAGNYLGMVRDGIFRRLVLASIFNFGALFLYIASAPAFVLDILKLNERQFAWLFVPVIGGMMIGAFVSGGLAARRSAAQVLALSYGLMACGHALNLAVAFFLLPGVPWSVLPIALVGVGVALGLPSITLLLLDRYPQTRGAASSLQAALTLLFNATLAGTVAPLVSHHVQALAITSASLASLGFVIWRLARPAVLRAAVQRPLVVPVPQPPAN
jgi:MFS transporter, DHA1 family, multidrug resistance protein